MERREALKRIGVGAAGAAALAVAPATEARGVPFAAPRPTYEWRKMEICPGGEHEVGEHEEICAVVEGEGVRDRTFGLRPGDVISAKRRPSGVLLTVHLGGAGVLFASHVERLEPVSA